MFEYFVRISFHEQVMADEYVPVIIKSDGGSYNKEIDINSFILPPHAGMALADEVRQPNQDYEIMMVFPQDLGMKPNIRIGDTTKIKDISIVKKE